MDRRGFLKLLGSAVAVGTAGLVAPALIEEPRRRIWQVGRNAPVGGPVLMTAWDPGFGEGGFVWARYDEATYQAVARARWRSEQAYADSWDILSVQEQLDAIAREQGEHSDEGIRPQAIDPYADESTVDALFSSMDHETQKLWRDASNARGGILTREGLQAAIDQAAERVAESLAAFGDHALNLRGRG